MKNLNKKILLIATILSLITAYLSYTYLKDFQKDTPDVEYVNIIVAAKDILPRVQITSDMLKEIKIVKESYVINSIQDIDEIVGMYSKEKILKGEVVPEERLIKEDEMDLSLKIPIGKRAISILVDEMSGVGDLVKPSDYVDIYVTVDESRIDGEDSTTIYPQITKLLLQNIKVLAIGKEQIRKDEEREEIPTRYSVTLAVIPTDGEKLVLAEDMGRIKLALRPLTEKDYYDTPGATREDLVPSKVSEEK